MSWHFLLCFGVVAVATASPLARDLEFQHSYHADERPQEGVPAWTSQGNRAEVNLEDGVLTVASSGPGVRHFFSVGRKDTEPSGAWSMSEGGAIVEFRVKCESTNTEEEIFRLQMTDGERLWRVAFSNGRCNGRAVTTQEWATYRVVLQGGKMQVSSEREGVFLFDVEGAPSAEPPSLLFGSFKASPEEASRSWSLDFIRWSNHQVEVVTK